MSGGASGAAAWSALPEASVAFGTAAAESYYYWCDFFGSTRIARGTFSPIIIDREKSFHFLKEDFDRGIRGPESGLNNSWPRFFFSNHLLY